MLAFSGSTSIMLVRWWGIAALFSKQQKAKGHCDAISKNYGPNKLFNTNFHGGVCVWYLCVRWWDQVFPIFDAKDFNKVSQT